MKWNCTCFSNMYVTHLWINMYIFIIFNIYVQPYLLYVLSSSLKKLPVFCGTRPIREVYYETQMWLASFILVHCYSHVSGLVSLLVNSFMTSITNFPCSELSHFYDVSILGFKWRWFHSQLRRMESQYIRERLCVRMTDPRDTTGWVGIES